MPRKTVRIEDLPVDVQQQLTSRMAAESAEKRLQRLLSKNTRLITAALAVEDHASGQSTAIFTEVIQNALDGQGQEGG